MATGNDCPSPCLRPALRNHSGRVESRWPHRLRSNTFFIRRDSRRILSPRFSADSSLGDQRQPSPPGTVDHNSPTSRCFLPLVHRSSWFPTPVESPSIPRHRRDRRSIPASTRSLCDLQPFALHSLDRATVTVQPIAPRRPRPLSRCPEERCAWLQSRRSRPEQPTLPGEGGDRPPQLPTVASRFGTSRPDRRPQGRPILIACRDQGQAESPVVDRTVAVVVRITNSSRSLSALAPPLTAPVETHRSWPT